MSRIGNSGFSNPTKVDTFVSPQYTFANGATTTIPNGLGVIPDSYKVVLVALSGNTEGFTAGQEIDITGESYTHSVALIRGFSVSVDADNFKIHIASAGLQGINTSFSVSNYLPANFEFKVYAQKFTLGDNPDITRVGLVPLETITVASGDADIQIDLAPHQQKYKTFRLMINNLVGATSPIGCRWRTSSDGVTFDSTAGDYEYMVHQYYESALNVAGNAQADHLAFMGGNSSRTGVDEHYRGWVEIHSSYDPSVYTSFQDQMFVDSAGTMVATDMWWRRLEAGIVQKIQIYASSGNLLSGTVTLYGLREAV